MPVSYYGQDIFVLNINTNNRAFIAAALCRALQEAGRTTANTAHYDDNDDQGKLGKVVVYHAYLNVRHNWRIRTILTTFGTCC